MPAFFMQHGRELLHAYLVLVNEYMPLKNALIPIVIQAQAIMERATQQQAQVDKEGEEQSE